MNLTRIIVFLLAVGYSLGMVCDGCTSAVVDGSRTVHGHTLLWKHRDTDYENNFVAKVPRACPGDLDYVGLFNAGDSLLAEAWAGLNEAGFGIINTASYNLVPDTALIRDREGMVMALALRRCRTLADFETLLDTLPRPMGVQANFGVIDATGAGAYYETTDNGYLCFPLAKAEDGAIIRTNFSVSGMADGGYGYIRDASARHILQPVLAARKVEPATFTETLSRSFYHSLLQRDKSADGERWVVDQDFIPRSSSSASVVIESGPEPVMWVTLGYPPCSVAMPVTVGSVPEELQPLQPGWHSKWCDEVVNRKHTVAFPIHRGSGPRYIDMEALKPLNDSLRAVSMENYRRYYSGKGK